VWEDELQETLSVEQLAELVSIEEVENESGDAVPSIVFDFESLREWAAPYSETINRPQESARFRYDPITGQVSVLDAGQTGILMNLDETVQRIVEAAYSPDRTASPSVQLKQPRVTAQVLGELYGLQELARSGINLQGSSEGRLLNALRAAERFDGVVIAPGAEFSFNDTLGEVSEESGFNIAHIESGSAVEGNERADDLMGGVELNSTAAFRSAFWAGLPIRERHAPAYRTGWYEPPVGLDAAVNGAERDLVFVNDTGSFLLIQAGLDEDRAALNWALYGIADGREVFAQGPEISDVRPAPGGLVSVEDERIGEGQRQQAIWAREGADAVVGRTVSLPGGSDFSDVFESSYLPTTDVVLEYPES
jgi:vancomycin resistance protein YoaR